MPMRFLSELPRLMLVVGVLALAAPVNAHTGAPLQLSAAEAYERARSGAVKLIDIRRPEEWRATGVAEGAERINMLHPQGAVGFAREVLDTVGGDLDAPIVLICRTGNRTARVQSVLTQMGFTNVAHVPEGMLGSRGTPGWIARGLPVDPCALC